VSTMTPSRVISADCHVNEPPWVFDRVPARYRDRMPKMMRGADGGDGWSFDGKPPARTLGVEAMAGRQKAEYQRSGLRFEDILPGNYDGAAHVKDMESDGIDVSVVYPNLAPFIYQEPDRELALACMVAYNDWMLEDFQGGRPARIVGLPMLPVDDGIATCLGEFERVLAKGARGMFVPGFPALPYHDAYYEPLWSAASDADVPLTFHRTFGGRSYEPDWDGGRNNFSAAGTVARFFSGVRPLTYMIFAGAFERHPRLKIVGAELNCGWLPFWAQTMDQQVQNQEAMQDLAMEKPPSACLGTNVFVTVLDDDFGFGLMARGEPHLADACMFSTDYPHSVTLWPNSRAHIERLTKGISGDDVEKVLSGNAARVYHV
jgi:predicted TIM-barrel fold metal-dependent hydrolase